MASSKTEKSNLTISSAPSGSYVVTQHTKRPMKMFAVFETELKTIALLNAITGASASVGASLISFALGIWINLAADSSSASRANSVQPFLWIMIGLGIFCFIASGVAFFCRRSHLATIIAESEPQC